MKPTNYSMKGIKPEIIGQLFPYSGSAISFDEHDIQADSISINHGTSVPGAFTVGGVILGSLSLTLLNNPTRNLQNGKPDYTSGKFSNFNWKGSHIKLSLKTDDGTHTQTVYMGDYFVDSHSEAGTTITLQCYDRLKYLDEYQLYEAKQASSNPLTFPTTTYNAIRNICQRRGFSDIRGLDQSVDSLPIADPNSDFMTERQFVSYCAQMLGKYAVVRYSGQNEYLLFTTYNTSSHHYDYDAGTTFSHDLRTEDITVTGVKVTSYDDKYTYTDGTTTGYQIVVEDNPLITNLNCGAVRYRISNAFNLSGGGLTYRPGTVEIVGTPALEAGDIIKVETGQESDIYMIATNIKYGTGLTISVTADADPADTDLRLSRSQYIKKMSKQAISDELNDPTSDLSQAIGDDGTELVTLPAVKVICWDATHPWFKYAGHKFRFTYPDPDPSYQGTGLLNLTQNIWCEAFGDDVVDMKQVTYPEQTIRVPKTEGKWAWVELLVTRIDTPSGTDYHNAGVSEATRDCPLKAYRDNPVKVRCVVERGADGRLYFHDYAVPGSARYDRNVPQYRRPLIMYNGFTAGEFGFVTAQPISEYSSYDHDYTYRGFRFAVCEMPLPGYYFDTNAPDVAGHEETGGKWIYSTTSQGQTTWNPIPYYDASDPSQPYFLNYYDGSRWENN